MKRGVPKRDATWPRPFSVKSSICNFIILTISVCMLMLCFSILNCSRNIYLTAVNFD